MKNIKNSLVPLILGVASTVTGLMAMIATLITNGIAGYDFGNWATIILAIACFILPAAYIALIYLKGTENHYSAAIGLVAIVFEVLLFGIIVNGRILTIAAVFSYDATNATAWSAVYSSVVAIIGILLSTITMVVSGFFASKN